MFFLSIKTPVKQDGIFEDGPIEANGYHGVKKKRTAGIGEIPESNGDGMKTEEKSTAGGKEFKPQKITKETLTQTLRDHFKGGGE